MRAITTTAPPKQLRTTLHGWTAAWPSTVPSSRTPLLITRLLERRLLRQRHRLHRQLRLRLHLPRRRLSAFGQLVLTCQASGFVLLVPFSPPTGSSMKWADVARMLLAAISRIRLNMTQVRILGLPSQQATPI